MKMDGFGPMDGLKDRAVGTQKGQTAPQRLDALNAAAQGTDYEIDTMGASCTIDFEGDYMDRKLASPRAGDIQMAATVKTAEKVETKIATPPEINFETTRDALMPKDGKLL